MTATTSTSSTATVSVTSVTTTSMTATATTTTSITDTTVTSTSVTATTITTTATTVTTTSITATTVTSTSVTATSATTTATTITATTVTTTSITATTVTTTSVTATTTVTTSTSVTATTATTTSVTATTATVTTTTLTTTSLTTTSLTTTSLTATTITTTATTQTTTATTKTETMTSSTITASMTSTATTTTTLILGCSTPFQVNGTGEEFQQIDRAASSSCDGLSESSFCNLAIGAGDASSLSGCLVAGQYEWFCPKNLVTTDLYAAQPYIQCRACSGSYVDTDDKLGDFSGMLTFGPNMKNGSVDETMVDFYVAFAADDCGHLHRSSPLAIVLKSLPNSECCEHSKYSVELNLTNFSFTQLVVVPGAVNAGVPSFLDDGLVIPLIDLTTTTTSTVTATTTVTMTKTTTSTIIVDDAALSGSSKMELGSFLGAAVLLSLMA
eukprot:CAMPEP_0181430142 /NCGR_PEP_ID=MMETSP1110-20121109/17568_1 /TAXON_ID=174948 /ORGANISM="Symbiodinium sp., Strain CCMP421" /LENGTH=441 /DNA_ID=CAMNT_0023553443 /DNA_START=205 /DNA_END=1530 /DNA_ORIENTATION=-